MVENSVPNWTCSANKWAMKIFGEWQTGRRRNKKACEEERGVAMETTEIQDSKGHFRHDFSSWKYVKTQEKVTLPERFTVFVVVFSAN